MKAILRFLRASLVPGVGALAIALGLLAGAPTVQAQDGKAVLDLLIKEGILTTEQAAKVGREAVRPLPIAVTPGGKETKLALGGYIQAQFESGGAPDGRYAGMGDRFYVRRALITVGASFAEYFSAKLEADFGAAYIAAGSGLRAQMADCYVQWNRYPETTVRLGQFKTPFGFEQSFSDTKVLTIERGLVSDRLTVSRQIGGMLTGDVAAKRVTYSVGAFNGNGVNTGNNDNDDFMLMGRLKGVLMEGEQNGAKYAWTAGINAFSSDDTGTFAGRRTGLGFDTQLTFGPATIQAEWLQNKRDPVTGSTVKSDGFSVLGAWAFDKHWRGVLRFDSYDSNMAIGNTETDAWIIGLDYLFKGDDLRLSVNYVTGDQPAPLGRDDRFISRLQVIF